MENDEYLGEWDDYDVGETDPPGVRGEECPKCHQRGLTRQYAGWRWQLFDGPNLHKCKKGK